MANLLDLPAEIFQMVLHELVDSISEGASYRRYKIGRVWRLRSVCRSFAAEIEREVLSQQPKESYSENYDTQHLIEKCLPRYMMQASRKSGIVNEGFFTRLQRMAHYIVEQVGCEDQKQRADIIEKTYVGLGKIMNKHQITHALWCDRIQRCYCSDWHDTRLSVQDKLCAALAVGAHDVLSGILSELSGTEKDRLYQVEPIWLALTMADLLSVDVILRHLETRPSSEQITLTQHYNMFSISKCIEASLRLKRCTAAQLLLDYYEKNLPCPSKYTYNQWVSNASYQRPVDQLQSLRAVLDFDTGSKKRIGRDTIVAVCANGSSAAIQEVLQHVGDVDKGTALSAPIFIAVRSGRAAAIQACLQAGASVDLVVASNIRTIGKTHITPLNAAVHRHDVSVANALIEGGATIPHISQWPTHRRMYRLLHEAASKLTDIELPDLQRFKLMSKEDIKGLQY